MATKTITLTGAEVAVTGLDGAHAHIRNDSTDTIYAAKMPGITAGADGVLSIPAGQAATVTGISGALYLLGSGSATVVSSDYTESPFRASTSSGGSAVDEAARTAISTHSSNAEIHVTADEKVAWNSFSNPNQLINPDFAINQRGDISTYDGSSEALEYFADMWMRIGGVSLTGTGVSIIKGNSPYGLGILAQKIENGAAYDGKIATLSAKVDGEVVTLTGTISSAVVSNSGAVSMDFVLGNDRAILMQIYTSDTEEHIIEWAKFELADIATTYCQPDPATELSKCQRYYQIRSTGDIAEVDLRPSMRATPTVTQLSDGNYAYSAEL